MKVSLATLEQRLVAARTVAERRLILDAIRARACEQRQAERESR
jgi:hypothetical protein